MPNVVEELKPIIEQILEHQPEDLYKKDDDIIYVGSKYEFVEIRKSIYSDGHMIESREIGATSYVTAMLFIHNYLSSISDHDCVKLLDSICKQLIVDGILRELPELRRSKFKLIINN